VNPSHPSPLHVEVRGAGEPGLILVHGFGAHGGFWRHWLPELTRHHRVELVDLMGFGQAATPAGGDYSPLAQGQHLAEVLRRQRGTRPIVIGHSLGAGVAVAATLRMQDDGGARSPAALVLISGAVLPQRLPRYMSLARIPGLGELFLLAAPPRALMRKGLQGIVHDPDTVDDEMVEEYRRPLRSWRRRRAVLRAARQISLDDAERMAPRLPELRLPVLLLWGREDRIIPPAVGADLAERIPRSRLVTLPGVGHLPPEEAPAASLAPVLDFIRTLDPPAAGH
jgi:pimeloyl-ACP methyl ester carboxylesterase